VVNIWKFIGVIFVVFLTTFPVAGVLFVGESVLTIAEGRTIHCPMAKVCTTSATMYPWYKCKATQYKETHRVHSAAAQQKMCIHNLESMGAQAYEVAKICSEE
jgi:hypothetical protein